MSRTIIAPHADNWVDRGEPAEPKLALSLAHLFNRHADADQPWLLEHASAVLGMVAAGVTDFHIAGYLRAIARELPNQPSEPLPCLRATAVTLWHIAKAALVRDMAERVLNADGLGNEPTPKPLGEWLASRLLTPEELVRHSDEIRDQSV
jgi:hypothetical protein